MDKKSKKSFSIYIPCYNSALTLERVIDRIPRDLFQSAIEILVIDNCSADGTAKVAFDYKARKNICNLHVISLSRNVGYGGSQKIAYRYFLHRVDFVVMLHSDGQYAPEVLATLLHPVAQDQCDMIFGSRIAGAALQGGMPLHRFLGNKILTAIQNFLLGSNLTEFHSGYRVFSTSVLQNINFEALSDDYHFDTEILILLLGSHARIREVAIPTFYGDEKNYVNIWSYGFHILVTTGTYFLHKKKIRKSKNWDRILGQDVTAMRKEFLKQIFLNSSFDLEKQRLNDQFNL